MLYLTYIGFYTIFYINNALFNLYKILLYFLLFSWFLCYFRLFFSTLKQFEKNKKKLAAARIRTWLAWDEGCNHYAMLRILSSRGLSPLLFRSREVRGALPSLCATANLTLRT